VRAALVLTLTILVAEASLAAGAVLRVEIRRHDTLGAYERLIGRVYFAVDPALAANSGIVDLSRAPRNAAGLVEFSSDLLLFRPRDARRSRGAVFFEIVNRGRDQSLGLMSGATQRDLSPESWDLGDRFVLEQGFTLAFLGWEFDVPRGQGLTLETPWLAVQGLVRATLVEAGTTRRDRDFRLRYCAADPGDQDARLTFRGRIDEEPHVLPRSAWRFAADGCSVRLDAGFDHGLYDAVYRAVGSPVAGLGLAAVRDFASYLKHGPDGAPLRDHPALARRVLGFGYSQSGRFLRQLVRDGYNVDEQGRPVFDGVMISSAGVGVGSFNHRFAMPGEAGNSVLSILRPVDVPPFQDEGLLARAVGDHAMPKTFYTFSSAEYWARAGSLLHTSDDGSADVPLAATSRLYFLAGTAHAEGPFPPVRVQTLRYPVNFAEQRWALRALVIDLDDWVARGIDPPASRYPTLTGGALVRREGVRFPKLAALEFPAYLPQVWRMNYGQAFATTGVITLDPPQLTGEYAVLVPQVDGDGNDLGGIGLPEVAVPLGTYTGWNVHVPPLAELHYLAGLVGSFQPFARTRRDRDREADPRPSIAERYRSRHDYLTRVGQTASALVGERFVLPSDVHAVLERAAAMWDAVVEAPAGGPSISGSSSGTPASPPSSCPGPS
jgi:hypothetical protein